ncbi:hypothetical protein Y032_0031g2245 [Ancylostoma ceylanicum]|nr:hypothetical protein Y032_0031g2245 [Ancylostoma ceylanicum]
MSSYTALLACAVYLLSITCFADASKHALPDCQTIITMGKHLRGILYDEVVAAIKKDNMEYDCKLEKIAFQLARNGISSMPERNAVYGESPRSERLNLKSIVQGWKYELQLMVEETKFGCIVLDGKKHFKVACVFE